MAWLIWLMIILVCRFYGAEISDMDMAMIAVFYVGDCIHDLAKTIERRKDKCV